jgi:hypothetical protein
MPEKISPKEGRFKDEWGTGTHEAYEDRAHHRPLKPPPKKPRGNSFLRSLGGLLIVGGLFWGAYLYTSNPDIVEALRRNHGPAMVCGLGVIVSIVGKFIRL